MSSAAGWAVVGDWAINKEVDATHMLSPMPLSITLGTGSPAFPYLMPAVEYINGQAITLLRRWPGCHFCSIPCGIPPGRRSW
jgi:nitrate/nitrite transport system substrate-binding protein